MEKFEDLVGPRAHDQEGKESEEELRTKSGEPLWMALLDEESSLSPSAHEVNEARNKLATMLESQKEELVKMCSEKTTDECRQMLNNQN